MVRLERLGRFTADLGVMAEWELDAMTRSSMIQLNYKPAVSL